MSEPANTGAPFLVDNEYLVRSTFCLTKNLKDKVSMEARRLGLSYSQFFRGLAESYFDQFGEQERQVHK